MHSTTRELFLMTDTTATGFALTGDYKPAGDQPQAIAGLVDGLRSGLTHQTLLGVTGSRQDVHGRERHPAAAAPDARARAQQDAGGAAVRRVQGVLPAQRGGVLRLLLRLLPAGSLRSFLRHLHREGFLDQRAHRADAPVGDQGAARAAGRDHRRDRVGDLRPRRSGSVPVDGAAPVARRPDGSAQDAAPPDGHAVQAQRARPHARHVSRARRRDRHLPRGVGTRSAARRAVRRRGRFAHAVRSAHGRDQAQGAALHRVPVDALRDAARAAGHRGRSDSRRAARAAERAQERRQAARSAAARAAHALRHRDDSRGRLLQRHRELLALPVGPRARRAAAVPVRLLCPTMRC